MIEKLSCVVPKELVSRMTMKVDEREKFEKVTGILKTRRWEKSTTALAVGAALCCMRGQRAEDVGAVIVVTQSPDFSSPAMAVSVLEACGLPRDIPAFDVNQSCTGFIYGMFVGQSISTSLRSGERVLVVCVDRLRLVGNQSKKPYVSTEEFIFSDAATAMLIGHSETWAVRFLNNGSGREHLCASRGGRMIMNGGAVFDFVTQNIPGLITRFLSDEEFKPDFLIQHQPNESMMKIVDKRAGFTHAQSLRSIGEYGNASMCSIPLTIAHHEKKILGKNLLLCGYGAGWSAAVAAIRWPETKISEIVEL